jgi:hypothetical protein
MNYMRLFILLFTLTFGVTKSFQFIGDKESATIEANSGSLENNYQFYYSFNYDGYKFSGTLELPKSTYFHYRSKSKIVNYAIQYLNYTREDEGYEYIENIKQYLKVDADQLGYSGAKLAGYIVAFAQSCVPYTSDPENNGYDYPKYPIETLVEMGGDCEDKSILAAVLLNAFGFESGLFLLPKHMIAAVYLPDYKSGATINHNNKNYTCIEATQVNKMGYLDKESFVSGEFLALISKAKTKSIINKPSVTKHEIDVKIIMSAREIEVGQAFYFDIEITNNSNYLIDSKNIIGHSMDGVMFEKKDYTGAELLGKGNKALLTMCIYPKQGLNTYKIKIADQFYKSYLYAEYKNSGGIRR